MEMYHCSKVDGLEPSFKEHLKSFNGAPNRAGPIPKLLRILRTVRSLKEPKEHLGAYEELSVRNPVELWTPRVQEGNDLSSPPTTCHRL